MSSAPRAEPAAPVAAKAHDEEWATPGPAGLVALAIACFCFFSILTGRVGHSATPFLAAWLLGGFVVQFSTGIIELREKNLTGGNVFLFFSAFFMLAGALKYLIGAYFGTPGGEPIDHHIDGWAWLVLSITLIAWTPAYLKRAPKALALVILLLDPGVAIVALRDLGIISGPTWNSIAGWLLLFGGIAGLYVATAIINNGAFRRTVMPMGKPFLA